MDTGIKKVIESVPQRGRRGIWDLRKKSFSSVEKVCILEKVTILGKFVWWRKLLSEALFMESGNY